MSSPTVKRKESLKKASAELHAESFKCSEEETNTAKHPPHLFEQCLYLVAKELSHTIHLVAENLNPEIGVSSKYYPLAKTTKRSKAEALLIF